jgi:undecaprenyl-diphosphatase
MPILHAIVLGLTQGLSEFLPISSSGHLILVPWLFGWHDFDSDSVQKAFDVALHIGTLVAAIGYFRHDLARYAADAWKGAHDPIFRRTPAGRLPWFILLSAIPGALAGVVGEKFVDNTLGKPVIIAVSLIVFGVLLGYVDRRRGAREIEGVGGRDSLAIGAAQVLALNPGTSRSGITITAARQLGFSRDSAARFSFLMSIPIIAGAVVYKVGKLALDGVPAGLGVPMLVGVVTAGIAGWLAVWGTLRLVRTRSFMPFVAYRVALGAVVLVVAATGWR